MSETRPREFWLKEGYENSDGEPQTFDSIYTEDDFWCGGFLRKDDSHLIHVIEIATYEQSQVRLKIAIEALKVCRDCREDYASKVAEEALDNLGVK